MEVKILENKISEMASFEPKDLITVKLLICYLIYNLNNNELNSEFLYDISVNYGNISYFYYNEAIDELIKNDTIISKFEDEDNMSFSLTDKGIDFITEFKSYLSISLRNRIMYSGMKYMSKINDEENVVKTEIQEKEDCCYLNVIIYKKEKEVLSFNLSVKNKSQAVLLSEKINLNPKAIYSNFVDLIINNHSI
jgi:hypothetical protein